MKPYIQSIFICLPLILTSCLTPIPPKPITIEPLVAKQQDLVKQLRAKDAQKLDEYLVSVTTMKSEVERAARSIKNEHASDPVIQRNGQAKYEDALDALKKLRDQVKADFNAKASSPSQATLQAADLFQQNGNEVIAYSGSIRGERFSRTVTIALSVLWELYSEWSAIEQERLRAILDHVDQRLGVTTWETL